MARILVIDDDEMALGLIAKMLESGGHEAVAADGYKKGMELFRKAPCDLVITDIFMPGEDGLQAIMNLRRDFGEVKIIAVSGGSKMTRIDFLQIAMSIGAMAAIKKPFERERLLEAVNEALAKKQGQ